MDLVKHLLNIQAGDISWVSCALLLVDSFREFKDIFKTGLLFQNLCWLFTICRNYSDYTNSILCYSCYSFSQHRCQIYRTAVFWICLNPFLKSVAASVRLQSSGSNRSELGSRTPRSPVSLLTFFTISEWLCLFLMSCYSLFCPFIPQTIYGHFNLKQILKCIP